jgi:hypothetical protein
VSDYIIKEIDGGKYIEANHGNDFRVFENPDEAQKWLIVKH